MNPREKRSVLALLLKISNNNPKNNSVHRQLILRNRIDSFNGLVMGR